MDRDEALRLIGAVREVLPHFDGPLYRLAQFVATIEEPSVPDPGECRGCGAALVQPRTGRPRKWCLDCAR